MKDSKLNQMLLPLVAALALIFPLATKFPANEPLPSPVTLLPKEDIKPSPTPKPKSRTNTAEALLCEFSNPSQQACKACWEGESRGVLAQNFGAVETLIATFPDPKESNFDYVFDRYLEATQRALEAAGYTFDRFFLPWLDPKETLAKDTLQPPRPSALLEPGVILFRKVEGTTRSLLVLFLVGETSTAGIHKAALQNALEQNKHLQDVYRATPEIRLLGPTFSGSATALAITLREWLEKNRFERSVKIISGSATAIDQAAFLAQANTAKRCDQVSFQATVTPSRADLQVFLENYLSPLEAGPQQKPQQKKIALLVEANTAYGQNLQAKHPPTSPTPIPANARADCAVAKTSSEALPKTQLLEITFPLHIAKLRAAAAKAKPERKNGELATEQRSNSSLPMERETEAKDIVPLFSELETASLELVLSDLLSTINRERINYLGLAASDVQDRIFLVREIQQHCPNVVIFTLNADLLYLHAEARAEFRGVLIVTPYPLFNPNQTWTYPFSGDLKRLQFSLPNAQGTYNATLALLGHPELMLEYGSPFDSLADSDAPRRPALWLSLVGRDRIWPIKVLRPDQSARAYLYADETTKAQAKLQVEGLNLALEKLEWGESPLSKFRREDEQSRSANEPMKIPPLEQVIASLPSLTSGAFSSRASLVGLLALSLLCCIPPGVLFMQLLRIKLNASSQPIIAPTPPAAKAGDFVVWLLERTRLPSLFNRILTWLRCRLAPLNRPLLRLLCRFHLVKLLRYFIRCKSSLFFLWWSLRCVGLPTCRDWLRRGKNAVFAWLSRRQIFVLIDQNILGQLFGDPALQDDHLKRIRREHLLACCLILLALALIIAMAYLMPTIATIRFFRRAAGASMSYWQIIKAVLPAALKQSFLGQFLALLIVGLTIPATLWMLFSFLLWRLADVMKWLEQKTPGTQHATELSFAKTVLVAATYIAILLLKARFAISTGLVTAATVVYGNDVWRAVRQSLDYPPAEDIFFFLRATDLTSGVSPLLPLVFIGTAAFLAFLSALRRLTFWEKTCCNEQETGGTLVPFLNFEASATPTFVGLEKLELRIKQLLRCRFLRLDGILLLIGALVFICWYFFFFRFSPTVEGALFNHLFRGAFSLAILVLAVAFLRFVLIWIALRRMLWRLSLHPLFADDAEEARKFFSRLPGIQLTLPMPAYASMTYSLEQARLLLSPQAQSSDLLGEAETALQGAHTAEANGVWRTSLAQRVKIQGLLARFSAQLAAVLEPSWNTPAGSTAATSESEQWINQGRLFLASRVTSFLQLILSQLQNLAGLVTMGMLLMLLALSSYPFQPRELLMLFSWTAVLLVVAITLVIFVQMGRDKVLSLLAGTTPGQLNWDRGFVGRVLLHGLLPVLALLGAQFPDAIGQFVRWISVMQGGH